MHASPAIPRQSRHSVLRCIGVGALAAAAVMGSAAAPGQPPEPSGHPWPRHVIDADSSGADGVKLGDINGDGLPDIVTGWEEGDSTRLYLNPGPAKARREWPRVTVGRTPSTEDAVFADLDGDGRLDIVSSTEGSSQRVFVHWAPASADALLDPAAWRQDVFPALTGLTRWMFAEPLQIDGRHGLDLVIGGKKAPGADRSVLGWLEAPDSPRDVAAWKWHPLIDMQWTMSINLEDLDGDGDADILYSERRGPEGGVYWLENPGPAEAARGAAWKKHRVGATGFVETMLLGTGDLDGDGLIDIAATVRRAKTDTSNPSMHSGVAWLKRLDPTGRRWQEHLMAAPAGTGAVKSVAIGDIDGDGRADLVVSCEHAVGRNEGVYWLRQGDEPYSAGWASHDISGPEGIKFDLVRLLDLDGDGDLDVLTCEERHNKRGLGVIWYENPGAGARPARTAGPR